MRLNAYERSVIGLFGGLGLVGFALVVMAYANDWWLSGIMTASIVAWLAGILLAIYCRPGERVLALGGVIAGFLYILMALGPWFQANVSPWLLSTRAFAYIETQLLHREPSSAGAYQTVVAPPAYSGGWATTTPVYSNPGVWTSYPAMSSATYLVNVPTTSGPSAFAAVGHWLTAWVCAGIGALAAGRISRRSLPKAEAPPAEPVGENPFSKIPAEAPALQEAMALQEAAP
jgi:hypothetical protein